MANVTIKDYQDWLKNNSKVKVPKEGEELSVYDEQANRTLYNQYVKQAELLNQKNEAEARVQAQKESALRDNYIAQAQAQKKAEDAVKMQGVATGVSESGLIDLYAQGAAARAGIINASDSAKNDIFSEYRRAIAESNAETNAALAEIDALSSEEGKTSDNQNAVAQLTYALENYNNDTDDFKDLKATYEKYASYLDEDKNYDIIQAYQKELKASEDANAMMSAEIDFENKAGIAAKGVRALEDADADFFGYNDRQYNAMMGALQEALEKGDIKDGEIVKINLRGLDNWNNSFFYYNGRFFKCDTWWNGRIINSGKIDKKLRVRPNLDNKGKLVLKGEKDKKYEGTYDIETD